MVDTSGTTDVQQAQQLVDPDSLNPLDALQTSPLEATDTGDIACDGFGVSVEVTGAHVQCQINIAIVIDTCGSTGDDTNVVVFLSDGEPNTGNAENEQAAEDLADEFGAIIRGIGAGENGDLSAMQFVDNTPSGTVKVENASDLPGVIVEPLTTADFLRFEITIEGFDENGDPITQELVFLMHDPLVITTQLAISIDCLPIDEQFQVESELTVTARSFFDEDPGNPRSGEQVIVTQHLTRPAPNCANGMPPHCANHALRAS